jgi:hypothetical protein
VLDVHDKAEKLLAELDATSNIKLPQPPNRAALRGSAGDPTVDPTAPTVEPTAELSIEPITEEDDDESLDEEPETVVDGRPTNKPDYPTPLPALPVTHTPPPGMVAQTPAPGMVAHTPPPGMVAHTPPPGMVAHTPAPGVVTHHPLAADDADEGVGIATIETGWSPVATPSQAQLEVAPRPMPPMPPRRTVGSVLLAPFRAIASWFRPAQPQMPPSQQRQQQHIPDGLSNINAQTYTEVNRMVQRRRKAPVSGPPPAGPPVVEPPNEPNEPSKDPDESS